MNCCCLPYLYKRKPRKRKEHKFGDNLDILDVELQKYSHILNHLPISITVTEFDFKVVYQNIVSYKKYGSISSYDINSIIESNELCSFLAAVKSGKIFYQAIEYDEKPEGSIYNHVFVSKMSLHNGENKQSCMVFVEFLFSSLCGYW